MLPRRPRPLPALDMRLRGDPGVLADGPVDLRLSERFEAEPARGLAPSYAFAVCRDGDGTTVGRITLRLSREERFLLYFGQVGYQIDRPHRGRRYATHAVLALLPLAAAHRFGELWITCGPENTASRRTLEGAGFAFVEVVPVPPEFRVGGITAERCRYVRRLGGYDPGDGRAATADA